MKVLRGSCLTLIATAVAVAVASSSAMSADAMKSVAMTAIVDHPALDAVQEGVKLELQAAGFEVGRNLKIQAQNAQGNNSTAAQIARKFVGDHPDAIVAISTPSAQAVAVATKDVPIVYSAVSDPVAAGLVKSMGPSATNVTGVSDTVSLEKQLAAIKQGLPKVKRIGVIYNPGEANSVSAVNALKTAAPGAGYTLTESPAPRSVDVASAAKNLVGKVDLIYVPTDNTVVSAFASVAKVADDAKIPVFVVDTSNVKQGATFGLGLNYLDIGRQTGKIVVRVLKGEAPGAIASQTSANAELHVSLAAAKRQGVTFSEAFLKSAKIDEQ